MGAVYLNERSTRQSAWRQADVLSEAPCISWLYAATASFPHFLWRDDSANCHIQVGRPHVRNGTLVLFK
jgi:hypothetical protein